MTLIDYVVLALYFLVMLIIGLVCMLKIKHQEDFFLGGRSFGKVMQAFAAFGSGTSADNPVTLGRTVYTSGLSGIWSVLLWLFVTPFYWFFGVWYRRMRHLTLGDWFSERYESRGLGAAYTVFGFFFYMMYLSVGFSAVSKVCPPLMGFSHVEWPLLSTEPIAIEFILVPIISLVIIVYGVLGGLRAAYWTDLIQGVFILFLSVMLIPFGLWALVEKFGDPETMGVFDGFRILHEQVAAEKFQIIGSPRGSEFPLYYIAGITLINLVGIVVQPHFIATGGGSARSETAARVGLVVGNFMKRFCTIGWALTGLIILALLADDVALARDPDSAWGIASAKILGPLGIGLVGLMLACLLAALMSSADCYMLVMSALFVRNGYAAYVRKDAPESHYIFVGRLFSMLMIVGAAIISLLYMDVFGQLKITWEMPIIFAAVFWLGMFWRRATRRAAWGTVLFSAVFFFALPILLPVVWPDLRKDDRFLATNARTTTIVDRAAAPADVSKRSADIAIYIEAVEKLNAAGLDENALAKALADLGAQPVSLEAGNTFSDVYVTQPKSIYWRSGVEVEDARWETVFQTRVDNKTTKIERYSSYTSAEGQGFFNLDFLIYDWIGMDLTKRSNAELETLRLPPKIITPFVIMILLSLLTRRNSQRGLDRYFVKMKTPVAPTHEEDVREMELSYEEPDRFDDKKIFRNSDWEFQKPKTLDITGFVLCFLGTLGIIWLAIWVAGIGG